MTPSSTILRARWVFPVDRPPIENGVVEIANGRIVDVRAIDHFSQLTGAEERSALIPGLVNAHTHLEFSDLAAPLPAAGTFADWIALIIQQRRDRTAPVANVIASGLAESAAAGVTTIGEIATAGWSSAAFGPRAPRTVAFREAIALDPVRFDETWDAVHQHLQDVRSQSENQAWVAGAGPKGSPGARVPGFRVAPTLATLLLSGVRIGTQGEPSLVGGISPHAPYSVAPPLFERLVELAQQTGAPLAVHLAETREELQLLSDGTGPLVDLFSAGGFWRPDAIPHGTRPLDYLRRIAALPRALVIHGNNLDDEECAFLEGRRNLSVVYCPRTHAQFRRETHPWLELRRRGVRVALGTDSRASNPDLSLWSEVQFLRAQNPQVDPADLLEMATRAGSEALGLGDETGTLTTGKAADVALMELPGSHRDDPYERLVHPDSRPIATMRAGRWISGAESSP